MDEPKISEESQSTIKDKNGVIRHPGNDDFSDEDLHDDEETGLTTKERRRKQKKKRRNTLLDQRIARDNVTAEEQKEADQTVVRKLAVNGTLIGLWYLFSLGISLVSRIPAFPGQFSNNNLVCGTDYENSTTSGCLTAPGSTFLFRSSPHPYTCLCNLHWPLSFFILYPRCDHKILKGMRRSSVIRQKIRNRRDRS
jgi:hypothetical protein